MQMGILFTSHHLSVCDNVSISCRFHKALQRVVKTAQRITRISLPAIEDVQEKRCLWRARSILKDSSYPAHTLFQLLPSKRRYRSLRTRTSRFRNSFFPTLVSLLNSVPRWTSPLVHCHCTFFSCAYIPWHSVYCIYCPYSSPFLYILLFLHFFFNSHLYISIVLVNLNPLTIAYCS